MLRGKCSPGQLNIRLSLAAPGNAQIGGPLTFEVPDSGEFALAVQMPAGGWYAFRLQASDGAKTLCGPFGVGEVYIVAGQSNVGNYHDARFSVTDPQCRVAAYSVSANYWRVAHDPQPSVEFADDGKTYWNRAHGILEKHNFSLDFSGGSFWPLVGDQLVAVLQIPIGFVNVAVGNNPIANWEPGRGPHFPILENGVRQAGKFRAILWQQGESDLYIDTDPEMWCRIFESIRSAISQSLGSAPDWLLAKSTYHPTVYNKPSHEAALRATIQKVWQNEGVFRGPDVDLLGGTMRSTAGRSMHLSPEGQKHAAFLWARSMLNHIEAKSP